MPKDNIPGNHPGFNFNYSGLKVSHSGEWNANKYHHPSQQHQDKLKETSNRRALQPLRRAERPEGPKPSTKKIDLATGKKIELDPKVEEANKQDLKRRNIHN